MAKARRYCRDCGRHVLAENDEPNFWWYGPQALLGVITLGLWFPITAALVIWKRWNYRCPVCGRRC